MRTPVAVAKRNSLVPNATGDGTVLVVSYDVTLSNVGSAYNTGTFTFTAPTTGNYLFWASVAGLGTGGGNNYNLSLVTTPATYQLYGGNPFNNAGDVSYSGQWGIHLTSGDTAVVNYTQTSGIKVAGYFGGVVGFGAYFIGT